MAMRKTQSAANRSRDGFRFAGKFYRGLSVLGAIAVPFLLGATLDSRPAFAQQVCGLHTDIVKNLAKVHSEVPQAIGISSEGALLEILVSSTGTWTILVTDPSRRTCLVATGQDWESLPVIPKGPSA